MISEDTYSTSQFTSDEEGPAMDNASQDAVDDTASATGEREDYFDQKEENVFDRPEWQIYGDSMDIGAEEEVDSDASDGFNPMVEAEAVEETVSAPSSSDEAIDNIPAEADAAIEAAIKRKESRRKRKKRIKRQRLLDLTDGGKDIRYRGPLSYRYLRVIAWVCLVLAQLGAIITLIMRIDPTWMDGKYSIAMRVLPRFGNITTALFLIATFATILNNSRKFSSMLIVYGGAAALFYALFLLLHDRYLMGLIMSFLECDRATATQMVDKLLAAVSSSGYYSFNFFIDLFLCTAFTFFCVYRPKKVFVGKALVAFRLFAILPVCYEIGSVAVKAMASLDMFALPTYVYPLLTTKPPLVFIIFVALTFFIKKRELLYRKNGKTREDYQRFLGTNLNSFQFSSLTSLLFFLAAILDILLLVIISAVVAYRLGDIAETGDRAIDIVGKWGFGYTAPLILAIPFIMLFSYTRSYKDTKLDIIMPVVGVVAVVLVYLEGIYQIGLYYSDVIKGLMMR